jgi:hypothetical protein
METDDINVKVVKSEKDEFDNFLVDIHGVCNGEPFTWPCGLHTDESWAAVERQRIGEFKRQVKTQF